MPRRKPLPHKTPTPHIHHWLLGFSILSLAALIAWWSFFISHSIREQQRLHRVILENALDIQVQRIDAQLSGTLLPAVDITDSRLEWTDKPQVPEPFFRKVTIDTNPRFVQVRRQTLRQLQQRFNSRRLMVIGESAFFFLLILLAIFFMYRFIRLEKQTSREVRRFWERVTHEFKTPVTGLRIFLESLLEGKVASADVSNYSRLALRELHQHEQLIENLLTGSQLMDRNRRLFLQPIDPVSFIQRYLEERDLVIGGLDVELSVEPANQPGVLANPNALRIILNNLIDNAIRYCPPPVKLTIGMTGEGRRVLLRFCDNGPGIPDGTVEDILRESSLNRADARGTGMGLVIVHQLVRDMGGGLRFARPTAGTGTCIEILLRTAR